MKHTFRALAERNFRLYFFGQALSLVGTWVQQVAMSWITYRVTGSAFMLGLIAFSGQIPNLLLAPVGGLLADRLNRRKLLVATQVVAMAVAAWLGYVSYANSFSP
jgi:MFS family permease